MKKRTIVIACIMLFASVQAMAFEMPFQLFGGGKKNVILIVPDGCSIAMWAAIRAMTVGTDGQLNIDTMPEMGRCRTYSADSMITDSAAAATALATGFKTRDGVLGMNAVTVRGDSLSGKSVPTILELAEKNGYATGLVATSLIQHATPAGFYSHQADRDWYARISNDLVGKGIDVIMGGGREYMLPAGTTDIEGKPSKRTDNRNILDELRAEGYTIVQDKVGFDSYTPQKDDRFVGIFNPSHMNYEYDRKNDVAGEPALWEMAEKAIDLLSKKDKGFFLMIEASRIDHAAHEHDTNRWLWDGIACDKTVGVVKRFAEKNKNTLVIVVPDHGTGGPHLAGAYKIAGSDSTLLTYTDAGFTKYRLDDAGFPVSDNGKPVAIQWIEATEHTGEDVGLFAMGPGSERLRGLVQNTDVFRVMAEHLELVKKTGKDDNYVIDY